MIPVLIIAAAILLIFLAERVSVTFLTRRPGSRDWIRTHALLHPNTISFIRLPMGVVSILLWMLGWQTASILWFAFWMITDLSDGTIARNCDLVTERGKWLDPLSDKALYFPGLLFFGVAGPLPLLWILLLIVTDAVGQASRLFIKKKAANHFGQAETALITVLLAVTALNEVGNMPFIPAGFLQFLTVSCAILAFLSFYCKAIPDNWYANSLTLTNFLCGAGAIALIILRDSVLLAFILVFVGQFFDLFDGRLARKYGSTRHGPVYDDIADATSFGLAIGLLIYDQMLPYLPPAFVLLLAAGYTFCVVFRLIRFLQRTGKVPPGVFEGLPAPAGALLAGAGVLLFRAIPLLGVASIGLAMFLMVSRIRYYHFGREVWPQLPNMLKIVGFVTILIYVNYRLAISKQPAGTFELICFALALSYTCLGIVRVFDRFHRPEAG